MKKYGVWAVAACAAMVMGVSGCGNEKGDAKGKDKVAGEATKAPATNGMEKLTAQQVSDKAEAELTRAKSVRFRVDGVDEDGSAMRMDLTLDRQGNCRGSMAMESTGSLELVKLGDKIWMKPDKEFWRTQVGGGASGEEASKLFVGKWWRGTTADEELKDMVAMCDLTALLEKMTSDSVSNDFVKGAPTTLDGQRVIPLKGKDEDGEPLTLFVALTGKPYPVKMEQVGGEEPGTVLMSDFDKPVPTGTPAESETIDVAQLDQERGGGA